MADLDNHHQRTKYQVGLLLQLDVADPEIETLQSATQLALAESQRNDMTPFGVWTGQDDGSELVAIAYQGQLFRGV